MGGIEVEISYQRTIGQSLMVVKTEEIRLDYQIEMCRRNRLQTFLAFDTIVADGQVEFWYDITGMQSLAEYVRHEKLGSRLLKTVLEAVCDGMREAEEYLVAEQSVLLKPELIYISNDKGRVRICCCPGVKQEAKEQLHAVLEYLLPYTDHGDDEAVRLIYQAYQATLEKNYGIDTIRELLREEEPKREKLTEEYRRSEEDKVCACVAEELQYESKDRTEGTQNVIGKVIDKMTGGRMLKVKERIELWPQKRDRLVKEFLHKPKEEELVFEPVEQREQTPEHKTAFLGTKTEEKRMKRLSYLGEQSNRDIRLEKEIYCVGSQEDADIVIDNELVSRLHARLNLTDGVYYIEDLNSRNGTWVNGQLMHYMEKLPLRHGDIICFAEEQYRYEEREK